MGYTHYFTQKKPATREQWAAITSDFKKLVPGLPPLQFEYDDAKPIVINDDMIRFNGVDDDGHETMLLERKGNGFAFCKTARKPYDKAVVALLTLAHTHAPGVWEIGSDGDPEDWAPVVGWMNSLGIGDFTSPI